jgi:GTP pyrophosphokinase
MINKIPKQNGNPGAIFRTGPFTMKQVLNHASKDRVVIIPSQVSPLGGDDMKYHFIIPPYPTLEIGGAGGGGGGRDDMFYNGEWGEIIRRWKYLVNVLIDTGYTGQEIGEIEDAFYFAFQAHIDQTRISEEHYILHCLEAAIILVENLKVEEPNAVIAELNHDTVEDTKVTLEDIESSFNKKVAALVDGVTKLDESIFAIPAQRKEESFRKLISAISDNINVALIKLADRLHNMRTLQHMSAERRRRIALETFEYYVPLADILGLGDVKRELEDLCFKFLYPKEYREIEKLLKKTKEGREEKMGRLLGKIEEVLSVKGLNFLEIKIEPRSHYSFHGKLAGRKKRRESFDIIETLIDLDTIVIITKEPLQCYEVMSAIESEFSFAEGTKEDNIISPKANFHQSLYGRFHIDEEFGRVAIKVQTSEMEMLKKRGIAAHMFELKRPLPEEWQNLVEYWKAGIQDSTEFLNHLTSYLNLIKVFTPDADPIILPKGSYLDFAFAVHSKLGPRARGAEKLVILEDGEEKWEHVSLAGELKNGEVVRIIAQGKDEEPVPKQWLWDRAISDFNADAIRVVRRLLEGRPREESVKIGKRMLFGNVWKKLGIRFESLTEKERNVLLDRMSKLKDEEELFFRVGILAIRPKIVVEEVKRIKASNKPGR